MQDDSSNQGNPQPGETVQPDQSQQSADQGQAPADQGQQPAADQSQQAADQAEQAEDKEWDDAAKELFPGIQTTKDKNQQKEDQQNANEGGQGESGQPAETGQKAQEDQAAPQDQQHSEEQPAGKPGEPNKTDEANKEGEQGKPEQQQQPGEAEAPKEDEQAENAARTARLTQRDAAKAVEETKSDVREKMFKDMPSELSDADGDPIRSVQDVMQRINPRTGEPFTQEEAEKWLPQAQAQFKEQQSNAEKQIERIAETNVAVKDEADLITQRYGEILKNDTALRDRLWAQYEKTLVKDPKTDLIIDMPVSLIEFYDIALEPYAKQNQQSQESQQGQSQQGKQPSQQSQQNQQNSGQQQQQSQQTSKKPPADRSDIFSSGQTDVRDSDEKEWDEAAKDYFGPKI